MKKIILSISCVVAVLSANSQSPTFQWAKNIGGAGNDYGVSVEVDASGNIYMGGSFQGTADFDPGPAVFNLTSASSNNDIFVSKVDASGNFVWAKNVGGTLSDLGYEIALDPSGGVYITGSFIGTVDFDPGSGVVNLTSASSNNDIFILKLDASGNFVWAKSIGASSSDIGQFITVDASGNVYTTGSFFGTVDFNPGAGVSNLTASSTNNAFILKLDASGNFIWAKSMEGPTPATGTGYSIVVDALGYVSIAGSFQGTVDFDPGAAVVNLTSAGTSNDIFIVKLDASGNFVWVKSMGGTSSDVAQSIAVDPSGNIYTTGSFQGTADLDPGVGMSNLTSAGMTDIFISKLDAYGNFVWAKSIGDASSDAGYSITADAGNIYLTGSFEGTADFDPGIGTFDLTSSVSASDIFILKLDAAGNFIWAKNMGGTLYDIGYSITLDVSGNIYTTGTFVGTVDFDPDAGVSNVTSAGNVDLFIQKMSQSPNGISENTNMSNVAIYPNPTNGILNILVSKPANDVTIEIYSSLGALLSVETAGNGLNSIELAHQPEGLYFVKVVSSDKTIAAQKIVKR